MIEMTTKTTKLGKTFWCWYAGYLGYLIFWQIRCPSLSAGLIVSSSASQHLQAPSGLFCYRLSIQFTRVFEYVLLEESGQRSVKNLNRLFSQIFYRAIYNTYPHKLWIRVWKRTVVVHRLVSHLTYLCVRAVPGTRLFSRSRSASGRRKGAA